MSSQLPSLGTTAVSPRQILAMLGNRTVVFGTPDMVGKEIAFTPENDSVLLPRVADSRDFSESRIMETLRVSNFSIEQASVLDSEYDFVMIDSAGRKTHVELKVRDGEPSDRESIIFENKLKNLSTTDSRSELWRFGRQQLRLDIYSINATKLTRETLIPLNIWETTEKGNFERSRVIDRINDWENRIAALYTKIDQWVVKEVSFNTETQRTVTMSEELMQGFAVPDRELPILDILKNQEPIASLVPRGLWVLGANGRMDLITRKGTRLIVYRNEEPEGWLIVEADDRRKTTRFDEESFWDLVGRE